ncbi:unnamed protein product [Caenorhabditis angaria]|uniref:Peptidase M13 N-terminal domain-containing protein n=1 Tax=Caenorhabditis angaria TaxID=860376 RepID=A0A9P1NB86_9PELO|nr:unnamed protein product [Caenorhabditis angaria]
MLKLIIFLSIFNISFSTANVFSEYLRSSIDWNVEPCDNFYRHACRKLNNPDFSFVLRGQFKKLVEDQPYFNENEEIMKFYKFLKVPTDKSMILFRNQIMKEYSDCEDQGFLKNMGEMFTKYSKNAGICVEDILGGKVERTRMNFYKCVLIFVDSIDEQYKNRRNYIHNELIPRLNLYNWIVEKGQNAITRLNKTIEEIREYSIDLIKVFISNIFLNSEGSRRL